jgi:hypothetical protein
MFENVRRAVLESEGTLDRATRAAAADGRPLPDDLAELARKVRDDAARIEDADVQRVLASGRSEDEVFELIVATAFGAASHRLEAARRAMGKK